MNRILPVALALLAGCASEMSEAGKKVKIAADEAAIGACTNVGKVRGTGSVMGGAQAARDRARELGAKLGGTHILVRKEESDASGASADADVYKCAEATPEKDPMLEPAGAAPSP